MERYVPIKISHFCFALAHLSVMLNSAAALWAVENKQRSAAGLLKTAKGEF